MMEVPWVKTTDRVDGRTDIYVWPPNDSQEHEYINEKCACKPTIEREKRGGRIRARAIVHQAYDGRPGPIEKAESE